MSRFAFEILRHDVGSDAPPGGPFDLVHARLVLVHVRECEAALHNMVSTLKPGGWLLVKDFDVLAILDTGRADLIANRLRAGFEAPLTERGVDLEFGRKLPRLLRRFGLTDVGEDAYLPVALPPQPRSKRPTCSRYATRSSARSWRRA